jgi:outer membrane biosynthesis protein TonB
MSNLDLMRQMAEQLTDLRRQVDDLRRQERRVSVAARYTSAAGQSIPSDSANATVIDFGTKAFDTHNAVTTGANWRFIAPVRGAYLVTASLLFTNTTTWALGKFGALAVFVNNALLAYIDRKDNYPNSNLYMQLSGSLVVNVATGDAISVRVLQNSGAALTLFTSAAYVHCSIARV